MRPLPHLHHVALTVLLLLTAGAAIAAGTEQPLNDNELKIREATSAAQAVEAAAKAQAAVNTAQVPAVGDLSKYKLDAPEVKLDAKAAELAYKETDLLAQEVACAISKVLTRESAAEAACTSPTPYPPTKTAPRTPLLLASAKTRALLVQALALEQSLQATQKSLDNMTRVLRNDIAAADSPTPGGEPVVATLAAGALLPAISAVGEAGVAFSSALRSRYSFGGASNITLVSAAFSNRVLGLLSRDFDVIHVDAIMNGAQDPKLGVLTAHAALFEATLKAQNTVMEALDKASQLRASKGGDDSPGGKQRKAILDRADALTSAAVKHNANADAVAKALTGLATPDAQGDSPLDQALRGTRLAAKLNGARVYTLSLALADSRADVVAKNSLLGGLKLAIGSHSIATWQLTSEDGVIVGSGSAARNTPLQQTARDLFSPPVVTPPVR